MNYPQPVDLSRISTRLDRLEPLRVSGRVVQVVGLTLEVVGLDCRVGEVCSIQAGSGDPLMAEVIGFRNDRLLMMPFGN